MSQLALATANPASPSAPHAQWAHDIRNALATVGLHLETLERLSGARCHDHRTVANRLRPSAPEGFEIRVAGRGAFIAQADP